MLAEDTLDRSEGGLISAPSLFLAFGSPMLAIDFDDYNESVTDFISSIPPPTSILVVSPFWRTEGAVKVTSSDFPDIIYDFEDGPDTLKVLTYPCAGNPELASSIKTILNSRDISTDYDENRGLDKGVWVPLYVAYPEMDVPVVQMSLPSNATPEELFKIGQTLSDLRKTGTLILVTGNLVHDEENYDGSNKSKKPEEWAVELNEWICEKVIQQDFESLFNFKNIAPHAKNLSDTRRMDTLFFMLGTIKKSDFINNIFSKFYYGNTSMHSFAFLKN